MKKFFFFSFFLIILLFNLTFSEDEKVFFLLKDRKDSCFKTWTTEFPFQIESKRILLSNSLLSSNEPILFQNSFWIKTNLSSFESNWNFTLIAQETLVTEAFEQRWRNLANSKDLDSWKFAKVFLITSENEVTWNQTWIETIPFAHIVVPELSHLQKKSNFTLNPTLFTILCNNFPKENQIIFKYTNNETLTVTIELITTSPNYFLAFSLSVFILLLTFSIYKFGMIKIYSHYQLWHQSKVSTKAKEVKIKTNVVTSNVQESTQSNSNQTDIKKGESKKDAASSIEPQVIQSSNGPKVFRANEQRKRFRANVESSQTW